MLEHRWKKRFEVSLDVLVRGRDDLTLHGRMCDISADGMFIRLVPHAVSTSTVVEIEISRCGCLHGRVIHVRDEGIGVMFRSIGSRERRLLGRLIPGECATPPK